MKRRAMLYHLDRRPMYYGCAGTTMAALQYYNPVLADPLAYYASLLSWTFFFDTEHASQNPGKPAHAAEFAAFVRNYPR